MCSLCSPPTNDVHDLFANAHQAADQTTDSPTAGVVDDAASRDDPHGAFDSGLGEGGYHFDADSYHVDAPAIDDGGFHVGGFDDGLPDFG